MENFLYKILDIPIVYRAAQFIFAFNGESRISDETRNLLNILPKGKKLIDVGCGPESWLFAFGIFPLGLDITASYVKEYKEKGGDAVVGDATKLPFKNDSFDGVWSTGMLHHMEDRSAKKAISEMIRVAKRGGYVAIIDAVLPDNPWKRPFAEVVQKLDRGKYVRSEKENLTLLPKVKEWHISRFSYSLLGLECLTVWKII